MVPCAGSFGLSGPVLHGQRTYSLVLAQQIEIEERPGPYLETGSSVVPHLESVGARWPGRPG